MCVIAAAAGVMLLSALLIQNLITEVAAMRDPGLFISVVLAKKLKFSQFQVNWESTTP